MAQFEMIPVEKIKMDLENPRIARIMAMYKNPTAEQVHLALTTTDSDSEGEGSSTTFTSLKDSIRTNESIIQPIIVNKTDDGKLTVIEGNTRLLIYEEFGRKPVPGNWDAIPSMVYSNLSRVRIDSIRLQSHLVGTRDWNPYSKAKYLYQLKNSDYMPMGQIVAFSGGNQREVEGLIAAYEDMEDHYRPQVDEDSFDVTRFSSFKELQRTPVLKALRDSGSTKKDFAKWVIDRLVFPQNKVRSLPRILANKEAREVFLRDGADEALRYLDRQSGTDLADASIEALCAEIAQKCRRIGLSEVKKYRNNPGSSEVEIILDGRDELIGLCDEFSTGE